MQLAARQTRPAPRGATTLTRSAKRKGKKKKKKKKRKKKKNINNKKKAMFFQATFLPGRSSVDFFATDLRGGPFGQSV
eukprot:5100157-Alexandrium_andersonii.AAC.1